MNLRKKILSFIYTLKPFDLKGDAKFNNKDLLYKVSCVINFYKRTDLLRNILTCLREQDLNKDDFEIVLVEDRGGSVTGEIIVKEYNSDLNINYIKLDKHFGKMGYSRNIGITNSRGKYILLLDDDTIILQNSFLSELIKEFEEKNPDGIIPVGVASYCIIDGKYQFHDKYFPASKCTAYKKSVLSEMGGFVDEIIGQEDVEFYMRFSIAGKEFHNSSKLGYFHPPFIFNNMNKAAAVGLSYAKIRNRYPFIIWMLLLSNGLRYLPLLLIPFSKRSRMEIVFSIGFLYGIYCKIIGKDIGYS